MFIINDTPAQISAEDREALAALETGTIGHFLDTGFMEPAIRQQLLGSSIAGTAITVRVPYADSVIGHYALKNIRPGDILVIDRGGDQAVSCWGGTTSFAAVKMGLTGLIMDGAGNDIAQANAYGLPIWCRGATPVTTKYRGLGGELNVPIACGGVVVNPGDAVLADDNGVLIVPPAELTSVIEKAQQFHKMEQEFLEMAGAAERLNYPDLSGATAIVEAVLRGEPPPLDKGPQVKS